MSNDSERELSTTHAQRASPAADVPIKAHHNAESTTQAERRHSRGSHDGLSEKGSRLKEKLLSPARSIASQENGRRSDDTDRRRDARWSGGFLRQSLHGYATPKSSGEVSSKKEGKRKMVDDRLTVDKSRYLGDRNSLDLSHDSSPLSREVSGSRYGDDGTREDPSLRPVSLDPAQLVQMALSLSESRKRHASNTLPVSLPIVTPNSRIVSGSSGIYSNARSPASVTYRANLSRSTPSPRSPRHPSTGRSHTPVRPVEDFGDDIPLDFSAGTLARAEKARRYFELAGEQRRLLQVLPPLKPDAKAAGNYLYRTTSSPGYAAPDIQRVRSPTSTKHELGRQYNPLQVLRNRKLRARERRPLETPVEAFQDVIEVQSWVNDVERAARLPDYRTAEDVVRVPLYGGHIPAQAGQDGLASPTHRLTGTATSAMRRAENGWSVEPAELLADLYWTERGDNKTLVENRRQQRIFSARTNQVPEPLRRESAVGQAGDKTDDSSSNRKVDQEDAACRKHRPFLSLHKADHTRRNRLPHLKRSASVSSASSAENDKVTPLGIVDPADHMNTGPLQRHMEAMIAKEERGELITPDTASPDHWESNDTAIEYQRSRATSGVDRTLNSVPIGTLSTIMSHEEMEIGDAEDQAHHILSEEVRSSMDSELPQTPVHTNPVPSLTLDVSPATDNTPPSVNKSKSSRFLPHFRSKSKDRNTTEQKDFTVASDNDRSREPSGNPIDQTRLSIESARPSQFNRHRTNESVNSFNTKRSGIQKVSTSDGSIKEPASAVGRFFRGARLGERLRGEASRSSKAPRGREHDESAPDNASAVISYSSDSDVSDIETVPGLTSTNDSEASPRTSIDRTRRIRPNGIKLPTFRPAAAREKLAPQLGVSNTTGETRDDPVSRQAALQRQTNRSERFAKLAPPRIDISAEDDDYSTDKASLGSPLGDDRRKSYGFLAMNGGQHSARSSAVSLGEPGAIGRTGQKVPMTALSKLQYDAKRRHWSISDPAQRHRSPARVDEHISPRDIARARTLILASGIKARAIIYRASVPQDPPPAFLLKAATTAAASTPRAAALKDSHMTAATILSTHLSSTLESFATLTQKFSASTAPALHTRLGEMRSLVSERLTHAVHNASDEADAFNVRLTTEQTLRLKQVDDAVDAMLRLRRRQWRWLKTSGFKVLEWAVLGLMWGIWSVVVCVKFVKRLVMLVFAVLRWLFWW